MKAVALNTTDVLPILSVTPGFRGRMVNTDSRLIDPDDPARLDADEFYLACQITKRMNQDRTCFPSIKTLSKDCGWCIDKIQAVKSRLESKGVISVRKGGGTLSNLYTVLSPYLGIYLVGNNTSDENNTVHPLVVSTPPQGDNTPLPQGDKSGKEVLSIQVLNNEELSIEEINQREKYFLLDSIREVYKEIILSLFPQFDDHTHTPEIFPVDGDKFRDVLEPTIKKTLVKIWGAAENLHSAYSSLKKPIPKWRNWNSTWNNEREGKPDAKHDAIDMVQSYAEFCKQTKTYIITDPEKLSEKILQADWCQKLKDYADSRFPHEYDPMDDFDGSPDWIMHYYYEQQMIYVDRKNERRNCINGF